MKLTEDDSLAMQDQLVGELGSSPSPAITGCCGARKMRFTPPSGGSGKSSSMRVIYKYFKTLQLIVLVITYPKNMQEDISSDDKKKFCKALATIEAEFTKQQKGKS